MKKARILFKDNSLHRVYEYNAAIHRIFGSRSPPPPYFIPSHNSSVTDPPKLTHEIQDEYWSLKVPLDAPQRDLHYLFEVFTRYYKEIRTADGIIDLLKSSGYMGTYGYLSVLDEITHPDYEIPSPHFSRLIQTLDVRLRVDNNSRLFVSAMSHHDIVMDYARAPIWGARSERSPLANNQYGYPIITYPDPTPKEPNVEKYVQRLCGTMAVLGVTDSCDCIAMQLVPTLRLDEPYTIDSPDEALRIYRFYQSYAKSRTGRYRTVELLKDHARNKSLRENMQQATNFVGEFNLESRVKHRVPAPYKP